MEGADGEGPQQPQQQQQRSELVQALEAASWVERGEGIPVGVLRCPTPHLQSFRTWLVKRVGKVRLTVSCLQGDAEHRVIRLPMVAAMALDADLADQAEFLQRIGATYHPGIRRFCPLLEQPPPLPVASRSHRFTFAEAFAGIGGFRLGLEPLGGHCCFASEIDANARATYVLNFGDSSELTELIGDVTDIYAGQLPEFDLLTGGFPCQPFTLRNTAGGDARGLNDTRGQLYLELVRLLKYCQPRAFLFENVASLVTEKGGRRNKRCEPVSATQTGSTFRLILAAFERAGYTVSWRILNSRHWLPQMRERVYIVGLRQDLGREMAWPELGNGLSSTVRSILEPPTSAAVSESSLTAEQWARICSKKFTQKAGRWPNRVTDAGGHEREIQLDGKAPTLTSSYHNASSLSTKYIFEEADGTRRELPRFLTVRECARLMGFPDSYQLQQGTEHMRGRAYHQVGNAVCPPVVQAIGQSIVDLLSTP